MVEGAGRLLERLHEIQPDREEVELALMQNLLLRDRVDIAIPMLQAWIAERPDDLDRKLMLAELRASHPDDDVRNGEEAVSLASEVVRRTDRAHGGALDVLGAAFAENGEFARALNATREALALVIAAGLQQDEASVRARIALYEQSKPFRSRMHYAPADESGSSQGTTVEFK